MNATPLQTQNLNLVLQTREDVRAQLEHMEPHEKAEVSKDLRERRVSWKLLMEWLQSIKAKVTRRKLQSHW